MKKIISPFIIFLFLSSFTFAQTPLKFEWLVDAADEYNGASVSTTGIKGMADGSVVVVGNLQGTADFDPGPDTFYLHAIGYVDIFIAKYNDKGKLIYAHDFGADGSNWSNNVYAVALDDEGNAYMTGTFRYSIDFDPGAGITRLTADPSSEIFVASYDSAGFFRYAINIAETPTDNKSQISSSITVDKGKSIYITGDFGGKDIDFDSGPGTALFTANDGHDIFFAKYDEHGNYVFAKTLKGDGSDESTSIEVDNENNIVIAGSIYSTQVDFDPGINVFNLGTKGEDDVFFAKYDPLGNYVFAKAINGNGRDYLNSFAIDKDNNIILTGSFSSDDADFDPGPGIHLLSTVKDDDIFIAKYDENGNYIFANNFGGNGEEAGNDIGVDKDDNIYITGTFNSSIIDFDPGTDTFNLLSLNQGPIYFVKYTPTGAFVFAKIITSENYKTVTCMLVRGNGKFAIGGSFSDTLDVDPNAGVANIYAPAVTLYISKYDNEGNYLDAIAADNNTYYSSAYISIGTSVIDSIGNTYIAGMFSGLFDFDPGPEVHLLESKEYYTYQTSMYFAKYDKDGNYLFAKAIRGGGANPYDMIVDTKENIYFIGYASGSVDFDPSKKTKYWNNSDTISDRLVYGYFYAKYSKEGDLVFANGAGHSYDYYFYGITVDNMENVYLAGGFSGNLDFNPNGKAYKIDAIGKEDIFIAKYDPVGELIFVKNMGATGSYNNATDIKLNSKNEIVIAGNFKGKVDFDPGNGKFIMDAGVYTGGFVATYKNDGKFDIALSMKSLDNISDVEIHSLLIDNNDKIYVAGQYFGYIDFDPGNKVVTLNDYYVHGMFFASYNKAGSLKFVKGIFPSKESYSTNSFDAVESMALDKEKNIYVCGQFSSKDIDCDPGTGSVILVNENFDQKTYNNDRYQNLFIAKYDSLGNYIYSYDFDGDSLNGSNYSKTINIDKDGNVIYTALSGEGTDLDPDPQSVIHHEYGFFITKYSQVIIDKPLYVKKSVRRNWSPQLYHSLHSLLQ